MFNKKIGTVLRGLILMIGLVLTNQAFAEGKDVVLYFEDQGAPITTNLDLRISLWDSYDYRTEEIDGAGAIITSSLHYGDYQTELLNITPNGAPDYMPLADGYYQFFTLALPSFPDPLGSDNSFIQVEYKDAGAPDTDYQVYDFVDDPPWQNVDRHLLADNISYYTFDAGPRTYHNTFTLDGNNNSTDYIKLEFGETLAKSLSYDVVNDWFDIDEQLNIVGTDSRPKLTVKANASDPADQSQFVVKNSSDTNVFIVDQDGDVTLSGTVDGVDVATVGGQAHDQNTDTGSTSNTFTLDNDDSGNDVNLQFGTTLAEVLKWDDGNARFDFSDDVNIGGDLTLTGTLDWNSIDTTTNKVGWTDVATRTKSIVFAPEYAGAALQADGTNNSGSFDSGYDETNYHNYYEWTTTQGTLQDYDIILRAELPGDFVSWDANPVTFYYQTTDGVTTNNKLDVTLLDTANVAAGLTGNTALASATWASYSSSDDISSGTWTPGGWITVKIKPYALNTKSAFAGELVLKYNGR